MRLIHTWDALKEEMRRRFVPTHYFRELHEKLHRLVQGGKSVEDYHREMEMCTVRANIEEDEEVTIARFLGWLNKYIADTIEIYRNDTFEEMLDMAMKIEKQKKGKSTNKFQGNSSSTWGSKWSKSDKNKEFKVQNLKGQSQQLKVKRLPNLRSELVKLILTPQALVVTLNALNVWGKGILHLNVLTKELRLLKNLGGSS
jgi:hypothetical protein